MRKVLWAALASLLLAACGDSDEAATSTTTEATTTTTCPGFRVGDVHESPRECLPAFLRSFASQEGVELTGAAETQAESLCRRFDTAGVAEGSAAALVDWETGAAPDPADDRPTFIAIATAVYCPEHYDTLTG